MTPEGTSGVRRVLTKQDEWSACMFVITADEHASWSVKGYQLVTDGEIMVTDQGEGNFRDILRKLVSTLYMLKRNSHLEVCISSSPNCNEC